LNLSNHHERIVLEEAQQLAKERYNNSVHFALTVLYSKVRNTGDNCSASAAYELLEILEEEQAKEGKEERNGMNL
jgi:hypothetical protein